MLCDKVLLKFSMDFLLMLPEGAKLNTDTVRQQEVQNRGLKNSLEKQILEQCPSLGRPLARSLQP